MKRFLAMFAAFSIAVTACGSAGDDVIASVNGADISRARVDQLVPDTGEEIALAEFTRYLSVVIQWEAIIQSASSDLGIEPTDNEIDTRLGELVAGLREGQSLEDYLADSDASEAGIREFARQLVIQDAVEARLAATVVLVTDEEVSSELLTSRLDWTIVCVSHILVGTVEEAVAVMGRLAGGEDFAAIAREVSLETESGENGGNLGCLSPAGFVASFAAGTMEAEIGVPTVPIVSDLGFHIILVSQREEATLEIVREALEGEILGAAVDEWFTSAIDDAVVTVDAEIGIWVTDPSPQVLATN
ncbi:MAG: peptidylprolyl isomerase [Actinomycetota bacterium]|nr:peptidylprolyl isomerase [Actinomycetota bacterium]